MAERTSAASKKSGRPRSSNTETDHLLACSCASARVCECSCVQVHVSTCARVRVHFVRVRVGVRMCAMTVACTQTHKTHTQTRTQTRAPQPRGDNAPDAEAALVEAPIVTPVHAHAGLHRSHPQAHGNILEVKPWQRSIARRARRRRGRATGAGVVQLEDAACKRGGQGVSRARGVLGIVRIWVLFLGHGPLAVAVRLCPFDLPAPSTRRAHGRARADARARARGGYERNQHPMTAPARSSWRAR